MSIKKAVEWIALNDEPEENEPYWIASLTTVLLVADVFNKDVNDIAKRVAKYRKTIDWSKVTLS